MKILFICTGNTCRSCMAEVIFNKLCSIENVSAISAGLAVVKNSRTSSNSASVIKENFDYDISDRCAVQVSKELIASSDLVLTMTSPMREIALSRFPEFKNKIFSLNQYVGVESEIIDPYGGNITVYKKTFDALKNSIVLLINKLKEDKSIL